MGLGVDRLYVDTRTVFGPGFFSVRWDGRQPCLPFNSPPFWSLYAPLRATVIQPRKADGDRLKGTQSRRFESRTFYAYPALMALLPCPKANRPSRWPGALIS